MQTSYFNTNNLQGTQLTIANTSAAAQEVEILKIFKAYPNSKFRTFDIEQILSDNFNQINHDSVKRSITNLTTDGFLVRSDKACTMGPYGKPVNVWQLNGSKV